MSLQALPEMITTMQLDRVFTVAATLQRGDEITAYLRLTAATKGSKDVLDGLSGPASFLIQ